MESGKQLGPYEIKEKLGAGGMGEVYLASDARLGREVAIKVLPSEFATDPERLARFDQEARAAAALNHPHIAVVHDIGEEDGTYFMVQERLEGKTLRDAVSSALPLSRALPLATEIAEALGAAHRAGIVHRDLKPENIFVTEDGHAKVLDFGLAKLTDMGGGAGTDASMSPTLLGTKAGEVMGTAGYMAPEQAQGEEVDSRADLFALGCVLYEMVTGRRPFEGENVYETLGKIVSQEPEPLDASLPAAPAELQRIVRKLLAKDPGMRYQTAGDTVVDLRMLLRDIESGRLETTPPPAESTEGSAAGRGLSPVLVAALVILSTAAAAYASRWLQPEPSPPPVRNFDFPFAAEHPYRQPCCTRTIDMARDGSFVIWYGASDAGRFIETNQAYLRAFDSLDVRPIQGVGGIVLRVSPDGEWIAYVASTDDSDNRLFKMALAGGAPFDLGVAGSGPFNWAEDGNIYMGAVGGAAFKRIPENGGEAEVLEVTGLPSTMAAVINVWPVVDEGYVFAATFGGSLGNGAIYVVDLDSLEATELVAEGADPRLTSSGHLLWQRGGVVYAAPFDRAGRRLTGSAVPVLQGVAVDAFGSAQMSFANDGTLAWVPGNARTDFLFAGKLAWLEEDRTLTAISERDLSYGSASLSPDESRIAAVVTPADDQTSREVWIYDTEQGAMTRLSSGSGFNPRWSPDGNWVYFNATEGDRTDIWRRSADFSSEAELVLSRDGEQLLDSIAPDGSALVYSEASRADGLRSDDLWLLPLPDGEPKAIFTTSDHEKDAEFSPDGRYLAYVSNESGQDQVYVRELATDRRWTVSTGAAYRPRWARDGSAILYNAEGFLGRAQVDTSDGFRVAGASSVEISGALRLPLDVAADGRVLVIAGDNPFTELSNDAGASRINVTLNWFQELERLAPREQ